MNEQIESAKYYAEELVSKNHVIDDYSEWVKFGFWFADLGNSGRELFHQVSQTWGDYKQKDTDDKFDECLKSKNSSVDIRAFYNFCHKEMKIPAPKNSNNGNYIKGNNERPSQNGNSNNKYMNYQQQEEPVPLDKDPVLEGEKWLMDIGDVMEASDVEFIWHFLVKNSNNAIVASSEGGKTTLMSCLAFAIAMGWDTFMGWEINAPKMSVLIISTEDGISSYKGRLSKLKNKYGLPEKSSIRFIFDNYRIKDKIEFALQKKPCDLIIIDTWGDYIGGEYVGEKTRPMMNEIKRICNKYDGTPVYVHHTNKLSENIPDKSSIKGAGDFEQANRAVLMLNIFQDSRWLSVVKLNEFTDEQKRYSYRLDYDHDTGMVSKNGEFIERIDIVKELRRDAYSSNKKPDAKWNEILNTGEFIEHKNLVTKVMSACSVQNRAAIDRIKKAIENKELHKLDDGRYSLTAF